MAYKILLVDDDRIFREEFREALGGEYEVVEAGDGEDAIKLLKRPNEIDLAILDVRMPGIDGIAVLRGMREISPELAIIILTGYSTKDVAIEALKNHADDYIEKPLDIEKTREVIERVLEAKGAGSAWPHDMRDKIGRVKKFAERNYDKIVRLKDAAGVVCLSPKYLSRIFTKATGMRFSDYRLRLKIRRAESLLNTSAYNINEISAKIGYENTESFIRIFKKLTGRTPTEYRTMHMRRRKGRARRRKR